MPPIARLAPLALTLLAACASGDRPPRGGPMSGGPGGQAGGGRDGGFTQAARLVDEGRYADALPVLRCVATRGEGFEIAEYLAGYSAFRLARSEETPAVLRDDLLTEGFERMTDAAQAGWPAAQAGLAEALFEVANEDALAEAAYWAAVYRNNPRERVYGIDRLDDSVEAGLAERLGDTAISAAEQRAAGFAIIPLTAHETGPECARFLRAGSENAQRGDGGRRGRGGPRPDGAQGGGPGGGRGGWAEPDDREIHTR